MKFLAILFILSFFIVESHQKALIDDGELEERSCSGSSGTADPYTNLKRKKVVYVSTELDCSTLMTAQKTINGQLKQFTPTGVCNTGKNVKTVRLSSMRLLMCF